MNNTKHTPTPWSRNIQPASKYTVIFSGRNKHVAKVCIDGLSDEEIEANMSFIVRAVNSHEMLLAALEDMIARLTSAYTLLNCDDEFIEREVAIARAALVAAEAA